jgi:hypothetical protein
MVSKLTVLGHGDICRLRLGFKSLVKFMGLVGFCAGIGSIPINLVLFLVVRRLIENAESITAHDLPFLILFILVGVPVIVFLYLAFFAILAFPLYRVLTNRIYIGEFELLKKDDP